MVLWEPIDGVFTASASWLPAMDFWDKFEWFPFTMTAAAALITALVGAWLGASAAQKIAKIEKTRDELTKEVRSINAGIVLSYNISNSSMGAYRQHIRGLKNSYDEDVAAYNALKDTPPPRHLKIKPQLMQLGTITTPIVALQQICLDQLSSSGMTIHTVTALAAAIENLNGAIGTYNSLLESYRRAEFPPGFKFENLYLGMPVDGKVNNIHGDTVNGLSLYVNDVTFYSLKLCDVLREHGLKILPKFQKATGRHDADISDIDISEPILNGLIPQHELYESWLSGFTARPPSTTQPSRRKWARWWKF